MYLYVVASYTQPCSLGPLEAFAEILTDTQFEHERRGNRTTSGYRHSGRVTLERGSPDQGHLMDGQQRVRNLRHDAMTTKDPTSLGLSGVMAERHVTNLFSGVNFMYRMKEVNERSQSRLSLLSFTSPLRHSY